MPRIGGFPPDRQAFEDHAGCGILLAAMWKRIRPLDFKTFTTEMVALAALTLPARTLASRLQHLDGQEPSPRHGGPRPGLRGSSREARGLGTSTSGIDSAVVPALSGGLLSGAIPCKAQ